MSHKDGIELIARGLFLHHHSLLVCRNLKHSYCYLPGGHIEFGESAADALRRECQEEFGQDVTVGPLVLACELRFNQRGRARHEVTLLFRAELGSGGGVPRGTGGVEAPKGGVPRGTPGFGAGGKGSGATPAFGSAPAEPNKQPVPRGTGRLLGSDVAGPSTVVSLEPDIGFEWVSISDLAGLDLRPRMMKDWLAGSPDLDRTHWLSATEGLEG